MRQLLFSSPLMEQRSTMSTNGCVWPWGHITAKQWHNLDNQTWYESILTVLNSQLNYNVPKTTSLMIQMSGKDSFWLYVHIFPTTLYSPCHLGQFNAESSHGSLKFYKYRYLVDVCVLVMFSCLAVCPHHFSNGMFKHSSCSLLNCCLWASPKPAGSLTSPTVVTVINLDPCLKLCCAGSLNLCLRRMREPCLIVFVIHHKHMHHNALVNQLQLLQAAVDSSHW